MPCNSRNSARSVPRGTQHQQGFTLVEVLVVVVIFAVIGMASFQVVDGMVNAEEQSSHHQSELEQLQYAMLIMERDIRQMVARPVRGEQGSDVHQYLTTDANLTNSDSDTLGFVRTGWPNPADMFPRSALQPVVYRHVDEQLQRLSYPYVDQVTDEPQVQNLLSGITDVQFRFVGNRTNDEPNWQQEWERSGWLPRAVELTLMTKTYGEIRRVFAVNGGQFSQPEADNQQNGSQRP